MITKLDLRQASALGIKEEAGYTGIFTRNSYKGAYPNGSRIVKIWGEEGDMTPLGEMGTVLGSIGHPSLSESPAYFVEWDNRPRQVVCVMRRKIVIVEEN